MKIALCMITKGDEELESLKKAVASCKDFATGVFITTNSDKYVETRRWCKKNKYAYSHKPWDKNFADMRNFNFSQVPDNYDYIFWLDYDDVLIGGEKMIEIATIAKANEYKSVFFEYWYACQFNGKPSPETLVTKDMIQNRERLLAVGSFTWKGRLHETPIPLSGTKERYSNYTWDKEERNVAVIHCQDTPNFEAKLSRNREILELQLAEEKASPEGADPRTLLYLMKIYVEEEDPDILNKNILMGKEYLEKSGWDQERGVCLDIMAMTYMKLNKDNEALECLLMSVDQWPHQILTFIHLALVYYRLGRYRECEFWLNTVGQMDDPTVGSQMVNMKQIKTLFAELTMKLQYNVKKDTKKALEAATMLYQVHPTPSIADQVALLESADALNDACRNVDKLLEYLERANLTKEAKKIVESLPDAIATQPFAVQWLHRLSGPRVWGENEICYFASLGGKHFEEWGPNSLLTGIGGSETAVISLANEWSKMGYKVTVYGDPGKEKGEHNGVTWLPWYYFNKDDTFNIFIQWRNWKLCDKVKAKKFFVDLHDLYNQADITEDDIKHVTKFLVKSKFHRNLAPKVPDEKFAIISNGIQSE